MVLLSSRLLSKNVKIRIYKTISLPAMLGGSLSPQHGASSDCGWWNGLQLWRLAANTLNKQPRRDSKGWFSNLGLGRGANKPSPKNKPVTKKSNRSSDLDGFTNKRPELRKMDMRFGTWNVRRFYSAGSLMTVSRELARHKLNLVGVQKIRREGGETEHAGEYTLFYGKGNENHELGTFFFCA
jgi:hypothetical protein